jgi:hypothetical protein
MSGFSASFGANGVCGADREDGESGQGQGGEAVPRLDLLANEPISSA